MYINKDLDTFNASKKKNNKKNKNKAIINNFD